MMGAAESISDLRSLLSIAAEETGALKMNDADEDSVGWTTEGPLPMTFGHVRRAHAALAALEAALSAAEPVAWLAARKWEQMTAAEPWLTNVVYSEDQAEFFPCVPLYAAPPAPSVAVKALEWQRVVGDVEVAGSYKLDRMRPRTGSKLKKYWVQIALGFGFKTIATLCETVEEAKAAAQADFETRIRSALSAQVQDVAVRKLEIAENAMRSTIMSGSIWKLEEALEEMEIIDLSAAAPAKQEGGHVTSK
ncbi:hypothetical protein [Agrobacterium radiobacter]|uniref:hypothetical protein n=1 Tax=Agrobacterium radiobacter TaxID=362 RepID=UPI003CE498AF